MNVSFLPLAGDDQEKLNEIISKLNTNQVSWLAGYLSGLSLGSNPQKESIQVQSEQAVNTELPEITIIYGTKSGNSQKLANQTQKQLQENGFSVNISDAADYKRSTLKNEAVLLCVVATDGEGDPPPGAMELHEYLLGKRAPKLPNLKYSVLALGDSSYVHFCKTGRDFDEALTRLGAQKLLDRTDCDLDYEEAANNWINKITEKLKNEFSGAKTNMVSAMYNQTTSQAVVKYSRKNPFKSVVLDKIKLNGRGSNKENFHFELSLDGSGMHYEPGDALGIVPVNNANFVDLLVKTGKFNANKVISNGHDELFTNKLKNDYELTLLSKDLLTKYNDIAKSKQLNEILSDTEKLRDYIYRHDIIDLIEDFPVGMEEERFLELLQPIKPRMYSISSSIKAFPDEVHLTIGALRYNHRKRNRNGVCSSFLNDISGIDSEIPVFVDDNPVFKLPKESDKPIIMVGPGTGIAPFRAFMQEREAIGAKGKNWLFFGDQYFTTDFLYQTEWQKYLKSGLLNRMDIAFSRDTSNKVYVQHKLLNNSRDVYSWLQEGAVFYVCGDKDRMAKDVKSTIRRIIEVEGGMSAEKAQEYVNQLQREKRYLEDTY